MGSKTDHGRTIISRFGFFCFGIVSLSLLFFGVMVYVERYERAEEGFALWLRPRSISHIFFSLLSFRCSIYRTTAMKWPMRHEMNQLKAAGVSDFHVQTAARLAPVFGVDY